jgi:hypothetical protein
MKSLISNMKVYTAIIFLLYSFLNLGAQSSQIRENAPNVFIDCEDCDMEHMRTEINFVNFVTETKEADIHIIIITQTTGSGGKYYTLYFIGQREFEATKDTLTFNISPDDTYSAIRQKVNQYLKLGLISFVKSGPLADNLQVTFIPPSQDIPVQRDKWRNWVFRIRSDGTAVGEDSYRNYYLTSGISAEKVTEEFKTGFYINQGYSEVDYRPNYNYHDIHTSLEFQNTTVFSINDHWSWGFRIRSLNSTYMNTELMTSVGPAIEFNVFPYSKATTKQFRFNYTISPQYWDYIDTTYLYNTLNDFLWQQRIDFASEFVQKWGRIRVSALYSNYLHDFTLDNLSLIGQLGFRIVKGLEINIRGSYTIINDMHYILKVGPTDEDILLRRRQLPTSYRFRFDAGISYTFGSIYSNVVNPRFGY